MPQFLGRVRGNRVNGQGREGRILADAADRFDASQAGHLEVQKNCVEGEFLKGGESFIPIGHRRDCVSRVSEEKFQNLPAVGVILCDEYFHWPRLYVW